MDDLATDFAKHLFNQFLGLQSKLIANALKDCKFRYNSASKTLEIECEEEDLVQTLRSQSRLQNFVIPAVLSGSKILILSSVGNIKLRGRLVNNTAKALTEIEAIKTAISGTLPAVINLFAKHGLRPIYATNKADEFLGMPTSELLKDSPSLLVKYSDHAMQSLIQMEAMLLKYGKVENFELASLKANGDRGVYLVDAYYVKWAEQDARLTLFKSYNLLVSR